MHESPFFPRGSGLSLGELAELTGAALGEGSDPDRRVTGLAPLDAAGPDDLSFFDNPRYGDELAATGAGCIIVGEKYLALVRPDLPRLVARHAQTAFAMAGRALFPDALWPKPVYGESRHLGEGRNPSHRGPRRGRHRRGLRRRRGGRR